MSGQEYAEIVLFNRQFLHVEHDTCSAAHTHNDNDVREHFIYASHEGTVYLFCHTQSVLLNGL